MNIPIETNDRPEIPDNITPAVYFNTLVKDRINKCPIPKIKTMNILIEFNITGEGKNSGRWGLFIEKGLVCNVIYANDNDLAHYKQEPNATFTMNGETFLSIVKKEITPQKAFFAGKVNVQGDLLLALKANALICYL